MPSRLDAAGVAEEIAADFKLKQNTNHAVTKNRSFEHYARLLFARALALRGDPTRQLKDGGGLQSLAILEPQKTQLRGLFASLARAKARAGRRRCLRAGSDEGMGRRSRIRACSCSVYL